MAGTRREAGIGRLSRLLAPLKSFLIRLTRRPRSPQPSPKPSDRLHISSPTISAELPGIPPSSNSSPQNCDVDVARLSSPTIPHDLYQKNLERLPQSPTQGFNGLASTGWHVLRQTLSVTKEFSEVFPPLKAAIGGLLSIMEFVDMINVVQEDFNELATRIESFNRLLERYQTQQAELPRSVKDRLSKFSGALNGQIEIIRDKMRRGVVKRTLEAPSDSQELVRIVRTLTALVDGFAIDTAISTDINVEEIRSQIGKLTTVAQRIDRYLQVNVEAILRPIRSALFELDEYHEEYKGCLPGTRTAILIRAKETLRSALTSGDGQKFWLTGVSGSGKSTLSTSLVSALRADGITVATFFCRRDQVDRCNPCRVIPTLAWYLASELPEFRTSLGPILLELEEGRKALPTHPMAQLNTLLLRPLWDLATVHASRPCLSPPIVILIDALDESDESSRLLLVDAFTSINFPVGVSIVLVSRKTRDLKQRLQSIPVLLDLDQHLHSPDMDHDIRLYLENRLRYIREQQHEDANWPSEIEVSSLTKRADGLFIWAVIACNFIEQPSCRNELSRLLKSNVVVGIDDLYAYTLGYEFSKMHGKDAWVRDYRSVMGCIICSISPLSPTDIAFLLGKRLNVVNATLQILQPLLTNDQDHVRLIHASLADYLLDKKRSQQLWVPHSYLHLALARGSLNVLIQFSEERSSSLNLEALSGPSDFAELSYSYSSIPSHIQYSSTFWARHLVQAQLDDDELFKIGNLVKTFLESSFLSWVESLSVLHIVPSGLHSLNCLYAWTQEWELSFQDLALDSHRFLETFRVPIQSKAAHIYISALPWAPSSSLIAQIYLEKLDPNRCYLPMVLSGLPSEWPSDDSFEELQLDVKGLYHRHSNGLLIFSSDGSLVAHAVDQELRVWNACDGHLICGPLHHNSKILAIAISSDNQFIASSMICNDEISIDGNFSFTIASFPILTATVAPVFHKTIEVYADVAKTRFHEAFLVFSSDSSLLALALNKDLYVWEIHNDLLICGPTHHPANILALEISSNNQYIACSAMHNPSPGSDGIDDCYLVDITVFPISPATRSPSFLRNIKVPIALEAKRMRFMAFSKDCLHIHTPQQYFDYGKEMDIWNIKTGKQVLSCSTEHWSPLLSWQSSDRAIFEHTTGWLLKGDFFTSSEAYCFIPYYGWDIRQSLLMQLPCPTAVHDTYKVAVILDQDPLIIQFPRDWIWDRETNGTDSDSLTSLDAGVMSSRISASLSSLSVPSQKAIGLENQDQTDLSDEPSNLISHIPQQPSVAFNDSGWFFGSAEVQIYTRYRSILEDMQYAELCENFALQQEESIMIISSVVQYFSEDPVSMPFVQIFSQLPSDVPLWVTQHDKSGTTERLKFKFIPFHYPKEIPGTKQFLIIGQRGFWPVYIMFDSISNPQGKR
ncbi:hypothetical protein DFJ43DRAFT_1100809 [Lentinula guzmanii]|uniref:Nephrocystin 3-like N-terminal domain-containing protein n=1 Tax=Lentinula guzmanii TaxID=2804957 RepID=A0AA38J864_9AGAR|nr:hypothetical protein DFJ43DRAFT_1100809 [Lentinula guzmanii]